LQSSWEERDKLSSGYGEQSVQSGLKIQIVQFVLTASSHISHSSKKFAAEVERFECAWGISGF
jgi:hypothetical protein